MRLAHETYTDISANTLDEGSFTVNASATMFYVTMSGIAKDKVGYPVREVCTNAWDASKGDFDVYLPTRFDPTFKVRDFGAGLTHDQVKNIYTRMFCSTKDADNDAAGGLGLGCKSPFAYLMKSDQSGGAGAGSFNVTSYQNGAARFYVMSIANDGRPKWQLLAETPTTERDGLEVSFAVRREDTYRFQDAAQKILWSFNPQPRLHGASFTWDTPRVIRSGTGWTSYDPHTIPLPCGACVRMGPVAYEIDTNMLALAPQNGGWPWRNENILFEAPIGSLSVQSSREQLAYDDRTTTTLKKLIKQFEDEYIASIQAQINAAATYIDAAKAWFDDKIVPYRIRQYLANRVKYKGKTLVESHEYTRELLRANLLTLSAERLANGVSFVPPPRGSRHSTETTITTTSIPKTVCYEMNSRRSAEKFQAAVAAGDLTLETNDCGAGQLLWLRVAGPTTLSSFAADMGLDQTSFINLDSYKLPKLVRGPAAKRGPLFVKCLVFEREGDTSSWAMSKETRADASAGAVYIVVTDRHGYRRYRRYRDWSVKWEGGTARLGVVMEQIRGSAEALPADQKFLVVNQEVAKKLHGRADCTPAHEWLRDKLEAKIDFTKPTIISSKDGSKQFQLDYRTSDGLSTLIKASGCPSDIVDLHTLFTKKNNRGEDENAKMFAIYKAIGGTKTLAAAVDEDVELKRMYETLGHKYPSLAVMLAGISNQSFYNDSKDAKKAASNIALYLNLYTNHIQSTTNPAAVAA
jgi:hypothetical protein